MVQRCAACGFAADTTVTLPEAWEDYLGAEYGVTTPDQPVRLPVCVACQRTIETLQEPTRRTIGTDREAAIQSFLDDLSLPDQ